MTLVVTDAIDPGPPQVAVGISPLAMNTAAGRRDLKQKLLTLTYSSTYLTGGTTLTVAQMAGLKAEFVAGVTAAGYVIVPTYVSDGTVTIKLYRRAADNAVLAEVPNTTAVAFTATLLVMGREA